MAGGRLAHAAATWASAVRNMIDDGMDYAYTYFLKAPSDAPHMIRRTSMTVTNARSTYYLYAVVDALNDKASRVELLADGVNFIAEYAYRGVGELVKTALDEPAIYLDYTGSSELGCFGRMLACAGKRSAFGKTSVRSYEATVTYDEDSNVTSVTDNIALDSSKYHSLDDKCTMDGLNRLTRAQEGIAERFRETTPTRWSCASSTTPGLGVREC